MKIKHIILSTFISSLFWGHAQAQTVDDALIFSKEENPGSARIKGMGNVQNSLGGDISSINGNPAGLGFFGQSDISITFNYLNNKNNSSYLGTNSSSTKGNFGVDQAGAVFHFPNLSNNGWRNFNVGLSYNKTQNFNNRLSYDGINNNSTIVNALSDIMNGDFGNDFAGSSIVEQFANASDGYFPLAVENGNKDQYNDLISKGHRSKTALSFGSNYNNKFYIGASLGFTSFRYEKSTQFIENGWTKNRAEVIVDNPNSEFADPNNPKYDFLEASYELFDNFSQLTDGSGIDLKLGMIFKPSTDWNIGVTINTPTWFTIKDDTRSYTDINYYDNETSEESFAFYESEFYDSADDYRITTPWKFGLGVTKFFNRGLISADVNYTTYNSMKYTTINNSPNNSYNRINQDIKDTYQAAVDFKIGGEYLITNIISGRAGFNYFGNPYKDAEDSNYSGSLGLGFKITDNMYADLAVVHHVNSYRQASYVIDEGFWGVSSPVADIDYKRTSGVVTLGFKF